MFDAYNIRKIAPRMLLAVIGVNISIYLCVAAVDITNVIGGGLGSLIRGPFQATGSFGEQEISFGDIGSDLAGGIVGAVGGGLLIAFHSALFVAVGGSLGLILMILLFLMLGAALIALAIMATVVIRFGAIILLTLVSPVAIAMLVLPGTEKYFKKWWEYFLKTLVVYPIIAAIFALSDAMGAIFLKVLDESSALNEMVIILVLIIVVYAPLFMIPFSFKLAGGFLGSVYDLANKNMYGRAKPRMDEFMKNSQFMNDRRSRAKEAISTAGMNIPGIGKGLRFATRARKSRMADYKKRKENEDFLREFEEKRRNGTVTSADYNRAADLDEGTYLNKDESIKKQGLQSRRSHFREAYKAGYASRLGEAFKNKDAEELKKRWGHIEGYDDLFNVAQNHYGSDHHEIMGALSSIDPTKYDLNTTAGKENAQQAANQVMDMQNIMGSEQRMRRAGVISMSTAKTAFKDHDEMIGFVDKAAGDDSTLRSMLLAEVQKNQDSAGRKDVGGGGFTETSISLEKRVQKRKELEAGGTTGEKLDIQLREYGEELTDNYLDVVKRKNSDIALGQAHERSFNATTKHTMKHMREDVKKAQARVDDPNDALEDITKDASVQAHTARLENLGESSAYFSGANRELVSKVLTGDKVTKLAGEPFKVAKEVTFIEPVKVNTTVKVKREVRDNAGQIVYENILSPKTGATVRQPKVEIVDEPATLSVRQLANKKMRGNDDDYPVYNTNKREFGRAEDAELDAASRFAGGPGPSAQV